VLVGGAYKGAALACFGPWGGRYAYLSLFEGHDVLYPGFPGPKLYVYHCVY